MLHNIALLSGSNERDMIRVFFSSFLLTRNRDVRLVTFSAGEFISSVDYHVLLITFSSLGVEKVYVMNCFGFNQEESSLQRIFHLTVKMISHVRFSFLLGNLSFLRELPFYMTEYEGNRLSSLLHYEEEPHLRDTKAMVILVSCLKS